MKNKENGITLIALIITIIVMLILVAVTINVALNGGLFDKAKTASDQTNIAKEKETLQTKALGYLNNSGYVDLAEFVSKENPLEGYTLTNNEAYVTASNGTNTFYITKQGGITNTEPQVNIDDLIPTASQKADAQNVDEGIYLFATGENYNMIIYNDTLKCIQIAYNNEAYFWACNSETVSAVGTTYDINEMQVNKWYVGAEVPQLYTLESSPIAVNGFTDVKNSDYLNRVIASFSSTNN